MLELVGKYTTAKIMIDEVEPEALSMIQSVIDSPASEGLPVAIMVDCHVGKGSTVGFTMPLGNMINPNWVGVDLSCGIIGGFFKSIKSFDLDKINKKIREEIPLGFNINENCIIKNYPLDEVQIMVNNFTKSYNNKFDTNFKTPIINDKWLLNLINKIGIDNNRFYNSLSSLGGGNHYIELGINELGDYLLTVHTGSRNLGQKVCMYHVNQAKTQVNISQDEYAKKLDNIILNTFDKKQIPVKIQELKKEMKIGINTEYLQGEYMFNYLIDALFCNHYATLNRTLILNKIKVILGVKKFDNVVNTIHNYLDFSTDDFMIRKGAVSGKKDELAIIGLSMKDGNLLVKAKGNKDWNQSLNHGCGRTMSRSKAKTMFSLEQMQKSMKGIVCDLNNHVVDESVFCYKNADLIKSLMIENADIIYTFKPLLNVKDIGKSISWKEKKKEKKKRDLERKNQRKMKRWH